jgi:O-methyltransferase involved in polyketide biosynthesis
VLLFCREYFEETYAQLAAGLFSEHPDAFPSDVFTTAAFTWAAVAVRSRSRPPLVGDDFALVPIADLVRRASTARACNTQPTAGRRQALRCKTLQRPRHAIVQRGAQWGC